MKELFEVLAKKAGIQQNTATSYQWWYAPNGRLVIEFLLKNGVSVLTAQSVTYKTWRVTNPSNGQTQVVITEIWPDDLPEVKVSTFPSPSGEGSF